MSSLTRSERDEGHAGSSGQEVLGLRLRVRPNLEIVTGADDATLLFDPASGRYTRLGRQAALLLPQVDGSRTGYEMAAKFASAAGVDSSLVEHRFSQFFTELGAVGVFENYTSPRGKAVDRLASSVARTPTKTLTLLPERALNRFVEPVAQLLRRVPLEVVTAGSAIFAMAGLAGGIWTVLTMPSPTRPSAVLVAVVLLFVQTLVHELSHAVVCRLIGYRPRRLGVALWYYFIPIAFVDRTDAYRARKRLPRAHLALAGPAADMTTVGAVSFALWAFPGSWWPVGVSFVGLELTLLVVNLNPLLPTDGQHALEAATGQLNIRGRAIGYAAHALLRRPLPTYLIGISRRQKVTYLAYGTACLAYLLVVLAMTVVCVVTVAQVVGAAR